MRSIVVSCLAILFAGPGVALAADRWEQPVERMPVAGEAAPAAGKPDAGEPFTVPAGFRIERLFVVPPDDLGSWVCLTTDPEGRIIASDQADKGLVRITPAALDGSKPTVVERIPADISGAQGLLWAFDALYAVRSGSQGSGLYRVTDSNGDGTLDAVEKLRGFDGGGEHGPHAVRLSPDGTRLVIVCGNHAQLPFAVKDVTPPQTMGGVRETQRRTALPADGTSRLPANWDEDQIITRLWDATGHAVGILAPGGYIASTDRDGKAWEIWSAGYRNAYDIAFNADGELFAYDSDMEWDFGMPWYRPTRVNHATSGSELGWRSGSGKWPACFPDSLPPCLEIGPGSPVGVTFGYGAKFPEKYQRALFICDWTFGTIYAVHLTPEGSTYRATKEQFLSRTPLPLTDAVVAADGAMYFTVGGRGGQSELYRVSYVGSEPTGPVDAKNTAGAAERTLRRDLEALHRRTEDPAAVAKALPHLASPDRFIRYAARIALEHQPIELWQARALALPEPRARIAAALAVARQGEPAAQLAVFAALDAVDPARLDAAGTIDLARAYELAIVRLGLPPADVRAKIAARFAPLFPSGSFDHDRELSSLLVALRAPGIVTKLCGLLAAPSSGATNLAPDEEELRQVIARNAEYGSTVRASLEKRSDLIQIHYAYALRTIREREAWTAEDRKAYHGWFRRAREWVGGNSFRKFLGNIEAESLAGHTENERLAMEAQGIVERWVPPPLPKPEGPGRAWTVETVLAAADKGLAADRDFEHGERTFAAARCVVCHRYDGDGGATGPDLTQAAGRFQVKDLVEAIVLPSKIISDQYKASVVLTADGRSVSGRIVSESPEKIVVVTDPEDATKFVEIARADIEEIIPAPESLMPRGLLDQLNESEVLDLLAYILSRGDDDDPRFAPSAPAPGPSGPAEDGAEAAAPAAAAEPAADPPAPIAHWTLDETVGMVASDAVGGHHGTIRGTSWAAGRVGGARLFVRANGDNIEVPYHPDFDVSSFTVSAWVRLAQPPAVSGIVGTRHAGDNTFDMKIEADRIHGDVGNGDGWIDISVVADEHDVGSNGQGGRLELDRWYLVTFVVDDAAQEIRIFLDGDCKKVTPYLGTARLMKPGQSLRIGNSFGPDEVMDGAIDDVKIWSRPLSPAEVESLAKS